jgi:hypothetical protein
MIYALILIVYCGFHFNFISKKKDLYVYSRLIVFSYPSVIQIILFIMRELLIASRHRFERIVKLKQQQQQQPPSQPIGRTDKTYQICYLLF